MVNDEELEQYKRHACKIYMTLLMANIGDRVHVTLKDDEVVYERVK